MIHWWAWALIWLVLVLLLVLLLVLGGIHLWRKATALLREASAAQEQLAPHLSGGTPVSAPATAATHVPTGWDAVLSEPSAIRDVAREDREERKERRNARRVAGLWATGRPRRWGDVVSEEDGSVLPRGGEVGPRKED